MPNEGKEKYFYLINPDRVSGFTPSVNLRDKLRDREPHNRV